MTYDNAWIVTCGCLCIYPLIAFALGFWYARNGNRIDLLSALKFWKRHDR